MSKFEVDKPDLDRITRIVKRAKEAALKAEVDLDTISLHMDLAYCHNAVGLDLAGLEDASSADFAHDIFGIIRHIDRETGEFRDHFMPRYAA